MVRDSLYDLPPLREIVQRYHLAPTKALGQNFLFDLNITDKIVRSAGDLSGCVVLEIGPGPGALTRSLLGSSADSVVAIERDKRCVEALSDYLVPVSEGRLTILSGDALELKPYLESGKPVQVIANLPYNVATPLLMQWLDDIGCFSGFTLMFQKEVVDRLVAKPGSKAYGRLAVKAQWSCEVKRVFDLPPQAFTPPPKVNSSVLQLIPREKPLVDIDSKLLEKTTALLFNQRRKTLRAILKNHVSNIGDVFAKTAIDPLWRPEQLAIEQICLLASFLK